MSESEKSLLTSEQSQWLAENVVYNPKAFDGKQFTPEPAVTAPTSGSPAESVGATRLVLSDGSSWPVPNGDLEWTLRYGEPTRRDLLAAASILSAYFALVAQSAVPKRNLVCREMRAAMKEGY